MNEHEEDQARMDTKADSEDARTAPTVAPDSTVTPRRIQRKRSKGWRMPRGAVYVGRPTKWGNPFSVVTAGSAPSAVEYFRAFCIGEMDKSWPDATMRAYRSAEAKLYGPAPAMLTLGDHAAIWLRGKDLACWCPLDQPCHADVLLELANAKAEGR